MNSVPWAGHHRACWASRWTGSPARRMPRLPARASGETGLGNGAWPFISGAMVLQQRQGPRGLAYAARAAAGGIGLGAIGDRKSTRLNSSHGYISYAVFCLKKKKNDYMKSLRIHSM